MTQLTIPTGASFNRGKSRQDFATPQDFRDAVVKKFGMPSFDLAADEKNAFCDWVSMHQYFTEEDDALKQEWYKRATPRDQPEKQLLMWLNPPFGNIAPWARQCAEESKLGARILFLIPASVGSNWWAEYVHNKAHVYFLSPRLCFDGIAPFPKDCALAYFSIGNQGYACWRWK